MDFPSKKDLMMCTMAPAQQSSKLPAGMHFNLVIQTKSLILKSLYKESRVWFQRSYRHGTWQVCPRDSVLASGVLFIQSG
jgi:hypothetical protein